VYHYKNEHFQEYFNSLANTDNFDYFKIPTIQKMIEFNFPLVREFTVKKLFTPYIVFQLIFVVYFNAFMENFIDMREYRDVYMNYDTLIMNEVFMEDMKDLYHFNDDIID